VKHFPRHLAATSASLPLIVILFLNFASLSHAGTIAGNVKFPGAVPDLKPIQVSKDHDYCGQTLPDDSLLVGRGGELKNAVVYIEAPGIRPVPSGRTNVLDTDGCSFVPRVMAMVLGEKLVLKNNDPKLHIVHSYLEKQTVFNVAVPFKNHQMELTHKIKKTGLMQVNCDTHAWMRGYIHVFDHPFFAVTDDKGSFSVPNIPPGTYTLKAWHEKAGLQSIEIKVPEEGEIRVNLEVGRWQ
jgi:plastocyanin